MFLIEQLAVPSPFVGLLCVLDGPLTNAAWPALLQKRFVLHLYEDKECIINIIIIIIIRFCIITGTVISTSIVIVAVITI
jgi:hypothetical protein